MPSRDIWYSSVDVMVRIADALEMSLDVLVGRAKDEKGDAEPAGVALVGA